jgi:hypothetical protein
MSNITATAINRIRDIHTELDTLGRSALDLAIEAGGLLRECKQKLSHGQWLNWLSNNFRFTDRTARNWMRISEAAENGKLETVSDLTAAYRLTTESREDIEVKASNDNQPEAFQPLCDSSKDGCRLWWDYCTSEVLARWAMGIPSEVIADHVGRPLSEVERIIRPRCIQWDSYGSDGIHVPAGLYDDCRQGQVATWMAMAHERAIGRLDMRCRPSPAVDAARRRLQNKIEHWKEEAEAREGHDWFTLFRTALDMARKAKTKDEISNAHFIYCIGEAAFKDARHACGIEDFPKIEEGKRRLLHWHVMDAGITSEKFHMLATDLEGFKVLAALELRTEGGSPQ